jgi:hypothetical protein
MPNLNFYLAIAFAAAFAVWNYKRHSPWGRLALQYKSPSPQALPTYSSVPVRLGGVRYGSLLAAINDEGLHLSPPRYLAFLLPPLLFPWPELQITLRYPSATLIPARAPSIPVLLLLSTTSADIHAAIEAHSPRVPLPAAHPEPPGAV